MTDVQVVIDDEEIVMSAIRAIELSPELKELGEEALLNDAPKLPIKLLDGHITRFTVGAVLSRYYAAGTRKWAHNTGRLWIAMVDCEEDPEYWLTYRKRGLPQCTFNVKCLACGVAAKNCAARSHHDTMFGITLEEMIRNKEHSWRMPMYYHDVIKQVQSLAA